VAGDPEVELAEELAAYSLDPLGFVLAVYPWGEPGPLQDADGPREWQREILISIGERLRAGYAPDATMMPVLQAISSGHGIGKSALVSWLVWWALSTCEDAKAVITANTEPQLRTKTWPEIAKWARLAANSHWFKVYGMSLVAADPARAKTWRADAVTWSETNLEAFAGLHNKGKRILLVFDEASGIHDRVWEVAEGALTDEGTEIIWTAFGNPTKPSGRFHSCFGRERHRWASRKVDSRTVPGVNKALFEEWVALYGEDSDFVRVRVRGEFPRASSMQFIPSDLVEEAAKREVAAQRSDALVIGVDVARFGDDQTVIAIRKGRDARMLEWVKLRNADTMQVAARVAELAQRYAADMVFIDGGGVGAGVVDRCRQLRVRCQEVQFGAKPDRTETDVDGAKYRNKRAEMWGLMRAWLAGGAIPDDPELKADLTGVEYGFDADNAILLERKEDMKKRGLASPDCGDALALTFAAPVLPSAMAGQPWGVDTTRGRQAVMDYDPFASV